MCKIWGRTSKFSPLSFAPSRSGRQMGNLCRPAGQKQVVQATLCFHNQVFKFTPMIPINLPHNPEDFHFTNAMLYPDPLLRKGAILRFLLRAPFALRRFLLGTVDDHPLRRISLKPGVFPQRTARRKEKSLFVSDRFIMSPSGIGAT